MAGPLPLHPAPHRFGDVMRTRGLVFECLHCRRPYAVARDAALRAWGEQGRIQETAARLRCRNCGKRGMKGFVAPRQAKLGSPGEITALVEKIRALRPQGDVS